MSDIKSRIASSVEQNNRLLKTLSETDYAPPALAQQSVYISNLQKELSELDKRIKHLETITKTELKDHEKYRDSTMKRFTYRLGGKKGQAKFEAKASKEEREYFEAVQAEKAAKDQRDVLQARLDEAMRMRKEFETAAQKHDQAQKELDALYESIFAGPTPDFPEEDQKEWPVHNARQHYGEIQQRLNAEAQAVSCLADARGALRVALANTQAALHYSSMDVWGVGGGFGDMAERSALAKAQSAVQQVMMLIDQARRMDPQIQSIGPMNVAQGNILSDVLFDNVFSDMRFHQKIEDSNRELQRAEQNLAAQQNAANHRLDALKEEMAAASRNLEAARIELQRVRMEAFEKVAAQNMPPPPAYS
ncbi:hypothetical protein W97_02448 [Coniosporium apollinis CBS 100218]|uniref:Uncharacterized protein n=1 Tax=Coniosporium apollinis (strain CBS 100218) TaxID=1168221 RepID=R7YNK3_CONA1|nr:uncharacterized protein W97_02448 [Coniosporium apollinis CBS 100218]EON63221.1 hypothetical protein W97_02448 [Coniosporium apollinis CBS 100218]